MSGLIDSNTSTMSYAMQLSSSKRDPHLFKILFLFQKSKFFYKPVSEKSKWKIDSVYVLSLGEYMGYLMLSQLLSAQNVSV